MRHKSSTIFFLDKFLIIISNKEKTLLNIKKSEALWTQSEFFKK